MWAGPFIILGKPFRDSERPELPAVRVRPVTRGCGQEAKPDARIMGCWGPPCLGSGRALPYEPLRPASCFPGSALPHPAVIHGIPLAYRPVAGDGAWAPAPSPNACQSGRQVVLSLTLKINGPPRPTLGCVATAVFILSCVWDFSKVV